jgi:type II secretory pathway component PulK
MTNRTPIRCLRPPRRDGAALLIILVVFAVTMTLAGVWTRRTLTAHRGQRLAAERQQVRWLAEAGVRRAAARLSADADYDGEEWTVAAAKLQLPKSASVLIQVQPAEEDGQYRLTARARYPQEEHRAQVTKTVTFTLRNSESEP